MLNNHSMMSAIEELIDDVVVNDTNATDFPDYDINDSFSHFEWAELAPVLVVYSLTFILGLVGEFNRSTYVCERVRH
ncbi:pyroglutamylated rfamide peptide receptor-like protein [Lasius niger]|uniref:Pyroglutamylated rfamide peptide receptor-like protein n=1 Tax=Lasius niger TaxID=67767 RepID=A0A0J7KZF6_LASNI|nr:pyroglutamylated rfamide peptide receptor-like protein [Lasius niger]